VASVVTLVALNTEVRSHRVETLIGSHELALSRVDSDDVADRESTFADQILSELSNNTDTARACDLNVRVARVKGRHWNACDRPDVVEVHL